MDQNQSATTSENERGLSREKSLKVVSIIASLVAICGIGFGVYGAVELNSKANTINDYKNQVSALQNQVSNLQAQLASDMENDVAISEEDTNTCKIVDGYLYVEEWGYKIKIPNYDEKPLTTSILRCEYLGENDVEQPINATYQVFSFNYKYGNRPSVDYSIQRQKGDSDWSKNKSQDWVPIELDDGYEYRIYYSIPGEATAKEKIDTFTDKSNYTNI